MLTVLIIAAALAAGWFAARISCSPSCRRGAYLWTPELEEAAYDRGRRFERAEEARPLDDRMSSRVMLVRTTSQLGPVSIGLAEEGEIDGGGDEMDDDWMAVTVRERPRTQTAHVEILHVDESR